MLNPLHLRTLTTVVTCGSFADAARSLGYTGSAVSQQISALERAVRMPLFEREAHSVRPTTVALLLAEKAGESLAALEDLEAWVGSLAEGYTGRIRLGSFSTASANLVPHAINVLHRERPDVEVTLDENEPGALLPLLASGVLDVAILYRYTLVPQSAPAWVTSVPLLREELFLLVPDDSAWARRPDLTVSLAELADVSWVGTTTDTAAAVNHRRMCARQGFEPRIRVRSNDYRVLTYFVRRGLGLALVPALGRDPMEGVTRMRLAEHDTVRTTYVAFRQSQGNPAVPALVDGLREAASVLVGHHPDAGLVVL